jgi:GNAT superfamily N-acetyltransferase
MRRELAAEHASAGFALSSIAGWNQTIDDWRFLLDESTASYGEEIDGRIVATASLICYWRKLGWIGMVLTHPDFRRQGLARGLVTQVMERAGQFGVQTVKLDATDEGQGLYESLGFRAEQAVERWQLRSGCRQAREGPGELPLFDLDIEVSGYDRRSLIANLTSVSSAARASDGYIMDRPGRVCRYLGPCVALCQSTARSLIEGAIARHPDSGWFWDLLPANRDAVAIAQDLGFTRVRTLTRMTWGRELRGKEESIFAIGGFEFG